MADDEPSLDVAAIHWPDPLTPCMVCGEPICELAFILSNDFDGTVNGIMDARWRTEFGLAPRPDLEAFACHERCVESTGWHPLVPEGSTLRAVELLAPMLCPKLVGRVRPWTK
jgi:hypothetical protein